MKTSTLSTILLFIFVSAALNSGFTHAQQSSARPQRGSVSFGAVNKPLKENLDDIERFRNIFVRIAQEVVPCVVSVIPIKVDTVLFYRNPFYRQFNEDPGLDFFFGPRRRAENGSEAMERRERKSQGLGSGVIVSAGGYILTNYHVIAGASEIEVRLANNRNFRAVVCGFDSLSDVAVIKIAGKVPSDLPIAYLGDSDSLKPGDWVAAVGNPFSLTSTVTAGIVSALGRQVGDLTMYQNFIQTDAAINPGNSGGALVNVYGELIGINTLIYSQTGGFIGIGFAIPINMARQVMEELIYNGKVTRGWMGISIQDLTSTAREALGLDYTGAGVLISDVFKGQPAEKAGLKRGDVILSIDSKPILNANELRNVVAALQPGKSIPVRIIRNSRQMTINLVVSERTAEKIPETSASHQEEKNTPSGIPQSGKKSDSENRTGIRVTTLTSEAKQRYNIPVSVEGVLVVKVDPTLSDGRSDLVPGDIITQAHTNGLTADPFKNENDFNRFAARVKKGHSVLLLVRRDGYTFYVGFTN
ncbi:MAG: Do family serine endopeptidase [Chitinispirillales bacterium]|jgi:serine protease Do|nr:Do family serine endopeptidase [Chitinispirillales bacterium]